MRFAWVLCVAVALGCASSGGGVTPEEAAALLPEGFPVYPGARIVEVKEHALPAQAAPTLPGVSAQFETQDPPDRVVKSYPPLLQSHGWKSQVRETQGEHAIVARRARQTALLMVSADGEGSKIDVVFVTKVKGKRGRHPQQPQPQTPPSRQPVTTSPAT